MEAGESIEAFGIGGPKLQAQGLRTVVDARELMAMGFSEVIGKLPRIFSSLRTLEREAARLKPDVAVVIDYPDFHFKLAKRLKKLGIPIVYLIPPKVWVWRKSRINFLKHFFESLMVIFPFEEEFYRKAGVQVKYVGNPLIDTLPFSLTREGARAKLGISLDETVLLIMPGSRESELKEHFDLFLDAAVLLSQRYSTSRKSGRIKILLPAAATSDPIAMRSRLDRWVQSCKRDNPSWELPAVELSHGNAFETMVAADVGLIKSGTSTLEAGLLGLPMVVAYKPGVLSGFIFKRLIRYRGPVGLVNLVAGAQPDKKLLAREMLAEEVTSANLADELRKLLFDAEYRTRLERGLKTLKEKVMTTESPSENAAKEVLRVARKFGTGS